MDYYALSAEFRQEKIKVPANLHQAKPWFDGEAGMRPYRFLAKNSSLIEQEFQQLFTVLKQHDKEHQLIVSKIQELSAHTNNAEAIFVLRQRANNLVENNRDRKAFWLQCYYYSKMLESYHNAYGKTNKYGKWSDEIYQRFLNPGAFPEEEKATWQEKILNDLSVLASTPWHISKIRDWVAFTNIYRIHAVFCKLTIKNVLLLAQEQKLLERLKSLLGWSFNTPVLDVPSQVFNALSVGLFAARFIINVSMLVKHVAMPSDREEDLPRDECFYRELNKRYCTMLNDVCWGTVNALSNYGSYFNVSGPLANGLTAGFLCFDVALLVWRRELEQYDYLAKKGQYEGEMLEDGKSVLDRQILREQLIQLEIKWQATSATYWFNVAAALVLMSSFSMSLIFAYPAVVPICYFMITVGVALYLSADMYNKFQEKKQALALTPRDEGCLPEYNDVLKNDVQVAWDNFLMTLLKNATVPLFITAAFTISWPVALLLTGLYIGYENGQSYFDRPEQLAVPLMIIGTLAVSWPAALMLTVLYLGYEGCRWYLEQQEHGVVSGLPGNGPT